MYTIPGLVGKYGLYDAYSYATKANGDMPWIGKSYLGIDKGLVLLMFENYSTQLIWKLLHRNKYIKKGKIKEAVFGKKKEAEPISFLSWNIWRKDKSA